MNERYEFTRIMFKENTGMKPGFFKAAGIFFVKGCSPFSGGLMILLCLTGGNLSAQGRLEIIVKNVAPVHGTMRVALYNRAELFMKKHYLVGEEKVTDTTVAIFFDNLPAGEYALSIFHDINDNGKLDTNLLGIPREPWGFSNNARGRLGPPDFEAARFIVNGKKEITILLNR